MSNMERAGAFQPAADAESSPVNDNLKKRVESPVSEGDLISAAWDDSAAKAEGVTIEPTTLAPENLAAPQGRAQEQETAQGDTGVSADLLDAVEGAGFEVTRDEKKVAATEKVKKPRAPRKPRAPKAATPTLSPAELKEKNYQEYAAKLRATADAEEGPLPAASKGQELPGLNRKALDELGAAKDAERKAAARKMKQETGEVLPVDGGALDTFAAAREAHLAAPARAEAQLAGEVLPIDQNALDSFAEDRKKKLAEPPQKQGGWLSRLFGNW